jgi:hypothetical protein
LAVSAAGRALGVIGLVLAAVGLFVLDGISVEYAGILLGALGYYFGLRAGDRVGQVLGIAAAVRCVISMGISGLTGPPQ